jgi:hypothetical protein
MKPFSHGMLRQWLKFMEALNVVIHGNGLNENGRACFNLTCSSLKGEALHVFNDKAAEQEKETKDTHIKSLCTSTEHVFPKDNPLQKQKTYMHNHVFLHLNDKQVGKFCTRWIEINNWLDKFLPFKSNQHFLDDQVKEILYIFILKHWQSYLQHEDKFNINESSVEDFLYMMEHYQGVLVNWQNECVCPLFEKNRASQVAFGKHLKLSKNLLKLKHLKLKCLKL